MFLTLLLSSLFCIVVLVSFCASSNNYFDNISLKTRDFIQKNSRVAASTLQVTIVDIDEKSLEDHGQWPWPRYRVAQLLQKIDSFKPKSIGVNILFPEPDRTSPVLWQKRIQGDFGLSVDISSIPEYLADHDVYLGKTLEEGPFVVGFEFLFTPSGKNLPSCVIAPLLELKSLATNLDIPFVPYSAQQTICNIKPLNTANINSGFLNGGSDKDGVLRKVPLLIEKDGGLYPSFVLATLLESVGNPPVHITQNPSGYIEVSFAEYVIAVDTQGNILLSPLARRQQNTISASDLLSGNIDPSIIEDHIIIVGSSAAGISHQFSTALYGHTNLIGLQYFTMKSVVKPFQTIRISFFDSLEIIIGVLLCLLMLIVIMKFTLALSTAINLVVIIGCWYGAIIVYEESGFLFSPFFPTLLLVVNFSFLTIFKYRFNQRKSDAEATEAQDLLQASEATLSSILSTIPDIVFRLDKNGNITFISPAVLKYVETGSDLVGRSIFEIILNEDIEKSTFKINERRTGDRATADLELRLKLTIKDTEQAIGWRFFSISAQGLYEGDGELSVFVGTQGIIRDISEKKQLERQLVQAQKMEAIGNLAAGVAHDLNNILSGIVSYPELLLLEIPKDTPMYKKIEIIHKSGKKAAVIVQDLLALARRGVNTKEVFNINTTISDYLESVEFQQIKADHQNISVHTNLEENLCNSLGSAAHLSKVVMNLVHNAFEAMPTSGALHISTESIQLEEDFSGYELIPAGAYITATFSDNGIGIPLSVIKKIFEPFFSRKIMGKSGSGLGMTVIWATVKDHGGFLDIDSVDGRGTTIRIFLPHTVEGIDSEPKQITLDDYLGRETILVIDDDESQLEFAETMLQKLGYTVFKAHSGDEAIMLCQQRKFDILILDMIMDDGMDGYETYKTILAEHPQQKAIIASGYSSPERVEETVKLGASAYIQKPYSLQDLGLAVRKALDSP